jgi:polar amino acid transport system substrate-binding protein
MTSSYEIRLACPEDIPGILTVQEPNLPDNGGSLSVRQSADWFKRAILENSIIVGRQAGNVVGYVLGTSIAAKAHVPIVQEMLRVFPAMPDCYLYGPVCVAESERGKGLAGAMFDALQAHMGDRPAMTFVRADNEVSLRAHRKMGMRDLGPFSSGGEAYIAFSFIPRDHEIAPSGKLRGAMIGIRVLGGVAEPIGQYIANRLGVSFEPVVYPNPKAYEESFGKGEWDMAIGPRVLAPSDKADVTPDVWLIDLLYLAAAGRQFASAEQVDRSGVKIGTIQNSPSDRFLTRTLKSAELVRIPLTSRFPADAIELLSSGKADVFGADSGLIDSILGNYPGAAVVPGAFNTVRAAVALPKGRSSAALAKLVDILDEAKRTGVVQNAIEQAGFRNGVRVAPE